MTSRYALLAPVYDLVSFEWPVYRPGRVAAVAALGPAPEATVLAVGCGTGLSMPLLAARVGPTGRLVGIDSSPGMLRMAARRGRRLDTPQTLIRADATALTEHDLTRAGVSRIDAVLFAYSLSLMRPWPAAWEAVIALLRPGTSIAIVDLGIPHRGGPVARAAALALSAAGGADVRAHPWRALERDCADVRGRELWGGHVQVRSGRLA